MRLRSAGFTLIELMISIAIASLLVVLAMPSMSNWVADNQIQSGAESVANGMRTALATAVQRNENVELILDPATGTGGWTVQTVADGDKVQEGRFEGAAKAIFTAVPGGATKVTFNGLAQVVPNDDASNSMTSVQVTHPMVGSRQLNVVIAGQHVRVCDPLFPATDPKGC
jgi:type IV fimbrial biogenesis protein FimT